MLRACIAVALAALLSPAGSLGAEPPAIRRVVVTGQPAPGGGAFDRFSVESLPIVAPVNDKGQVAFFATVVRGRAGEGFFLASGTRITRVVADGDPVPGGGTFAAFGPPSLNGSGIVAFGAVVEGRAAPGGVFLAKGDAVRMVVGAGDETPDGGIFAKFSERVALNAAGAVAFTAILKNAPIRGAIYVIDDRLRRVVGLGDAAPGGGVFSHFGLWPSLSATGTVGFIASVDGAATPVAAFVTGRDAAARVAGVGDALPGGGTLVSFGLYPFAAMSSAGAVSFATAPDAGGAGGEGV